MLNQLLSLYIESLIITSIGVLVASAIWIGLRAARKTDKTAKERQLHLYDILLIDIMTIPVPYLCSHWSSVYSSSKIIAKWFNWS